MTDDTPAPQTDRRSFSFASIAMAGGLAASYGTVGYIGFQFLKPQGGSKRAWMLVKPLKEFAVGSSLRFRTPAGATVNITRRADAGAVEDFKALSSVCPHLGCQVHWEQQKNRYFCPCHNGTFDADGVGTGGPPGDAGQSLGSFELRVERGLLYIEVPLETLAMCDPEGGPEGGIQELGDDDARRGPGLDPCLDPSFDPRNGNGPGPELRRSDNGGRPA